jgi:hypothetical protein
MITEVTIVLRQMATVLTITGLVALALDHLAAPQMRDALGLSQPAGGCGATRACRQSQASQRELDGRTKKMYKKVQKRMMGGVPLAERADNPFNPQRAPRRPCSSAGNPSSIRSLNPSTTDRAHLVASPSSLVRAA